MQNYEDALRRAHKEGWRDPVQISNLEIRAYLAGMLTERKRVLAIFKGVEEITPMRAMDMRKYLNRIKNNTV